MFSFTFRFDLLENIFLYHCTTEGKHIYSCLCLQYCLHAPIEYILEKKMCTTSAYGKNS